MAGRIKRLSVKSHRRLGGKTRALRRARDRTAKKLARLEAKRAVISMAEKKVMQDYSVNNSLNTCVGLTSLAFTDLLPEVSGTGPSQGTGSANRIGNMVKVLSGTVKITVALRGYDVTTNPKIQFTPYIVKLWVVSFKGRAQMLQPVSSDFAGFFDLNSSDLEFQGSMLDTMLPVNRTLFNVWGTRQFTLGFNQEGAGSTRSFNGGSFSKTVTFNIGKKLGKLLYNDTENSNRCTNKNCYLVAQAVPADQTTGDSAHIPCSLGYSKNYRFIDL